MAIMNTSVLLTVSFVSKINSKALLPLYANSGYTNVPNCYVTDVYCTIVHDVKAFGRLNNVWAIYG